MLKNKKNLLLLCAFILIVAISAFFRVQNLSLIEFKADEAINLFLASRPIFGHPFPPIGIISSAGIPNPPFFNYLMFPIIFLSLDPKTISFIIGGINSLAIGLFFLLLFKYYGLLVAFFSSALIALSPWSILFSRKIWPPDFILPFMVAVLYALHKIVKEKKDFFWLPYTIFSLFLIQLYHPTIFFVFLTTVFLLIQRVKPDFRYITIGILIGLMPFIPYLMYEIQNNCTECSAFLKIREKLSVNYSSEMFLRPPQAVGQGYFQFIIGDDMVVFKDKYPFVYEFRKILYVPYIFLPMGIFIFWKRYKNFRFLVYATLLTPVVYFLLRMEPFMHYFAVIIPLLFIFLGVALAGLISVKNPIIKFFSFFIFLLLLASEFLFNAAFFDILNKQKILAGDYGTTFSQLEKSTKERLDKYKNDEYFKEMIIANYVQRDTFANTQTLSRAVYDQKQTEKNINQLDQRLKKAPEDSRVEHELIAYYTVLPKTAETMKILREKTKEKPYYREIYEEIYRQYLAKNLKKAYRGSNFSLEYPSHWSHEELPSGAVLLKVDNSTIEINRDGSAKFNKKSKELIMEVDKIIDSFRQGSL